MTLSAPVQAVLNKLDGLPFYHMPVELRRVAFNRDNSVRTEFDLLAKLALSGMPMKLSTLTLYIALHYGVRPWHLRT